MAQHDHDIANAAGATFRADLNLALAAIVSNNSGAAAPSPTFAHMWWPDTTTDILKRRNAANSAWMELLHFDETNGLFRIDFDKGADIASAATTDISAATGNYATITGTTTITALGTIKAGVWRLVRFAGVLTLTHNGTSLILPGGASITTAAGDMMLALSEGSGNWRVPFYQPAALIPGGRWELIGTATASASASIDFTWAGKTYREVAILIDALVPATDGTDLWARTTSDGGVGWDAGASDYLYRTGLNSSTTTATSNADTHMELNVNSTGVHLGNAASETYSGVARLLFPANTDETTLLFDAGYRGDGNSTVFAHGYGRRLSAADVDGIRLLMSSGNITSGKFAVYGLI